MKTTITFNHNSVLKHRPIPTGQLSDDEKDDITAGDSIVVVAIRDETERGHIYATLDPDGDKSRVDGRNSIYFYPPHTDYEPQDVSDPTVKSSASSYDKVSDEGFEIITHYEGCNLHSYYCTAGSLTLGWGHCGDDVYEGQIITQAEADKLLRKDLGRFENAVKEIVTVPITEKQFSALVSFSFNCGTNALRKSTLARKLNNGDYTGASREFSRWTNKGLAGLVARRRSEEDLFLGKPLKFYN